MNSTETSLDLDRALAAAAADAGEALLFRRRAGGDAEFRRALAAVADGEPRSPEDADGPTATRKAAALYILGRDAQVGGFARRSDATQVQRLWAESENALNRPANAARILDDCLKKEPRDERVRLALAPLQALLGRPEAARETLGALASQVDRPQVRYALGAIAEAEGDYPAMRDHYEEVLSRDPENVDALFRLAFQYDLAGDDDAAISLYERARRVKPARSAVLVNLGILYEDRGDYERAADCYAEVLQHEPNHPRAKPFLRDARSSTSMVVDDDLERNEDRRNLILKTPISDFELSVRSRNCLAKMDIETLGDLIQKTEAELLAYKNFGETSLQEIRDILQSKGLRLGMRKDEVVVPDLPQPTLPDVPESDDSVMQTPVSDLDLGVRASKCMAVLGVQTVGELLNYSEKQLLEAKNFGATSLQEIKQKLGELGLSLRRE